MNMEQTLANCGERVARGKLESGLLGLSVTNKLRYDFAGLTKFTWRTPRTHRTPFQICSV